MTAVSRRGSHSTTGCSAPAAAAFAALGGALALARR
jgi:uncharacterized protein (TIGR03382 family)